MNFDSVVPAVLSPELQAFLSGFPVALLHAGVILLILFLGGVLYALLTPHKEVSQIRDGNAAAAVAFGGVIVGLAIPLAAALMASSSLREIALWGAATVVVQLLVFRLTDLVLMGLPGRVRDGEISAAVLLVAAKLAAALILAAAVSR
jgi:putative membrane protein